MPPPWPLLALGLFAGVAAVASAAPAPPSLVRASVLARNSPCDRPDAGPYTYHWPIRPFDRQHPIRGNFGDPRTVSATTLGEDRPGSVGSFTFHNGVDISAATGTPVYPVVSGVVRKAPYPKDEVVVATGDFRTFQYFHITPGVRPGNRVVAYRTVLGRVKPAWWHVHLTEIDGFRVHNPVAPGHLEPYRDHTVPSIDSLVFTTAEGRPLDPRRLHGMVTIAADAEDTPPLRVFPNVWVDFPVTPALVAWRMTARGGAHIVRETAVADFRRTLPPDRDFWQVYAAGTYQNFLVFGHDFYFRRPGRYLFRLTRTPLDTRRLRNGVYGVTVDAADVCGNLGSLTERVRIRN